MDRLTRSFRLSEFACHNGVQVPAEYVANAQALCDLVLQPLRDRWGSLIVISGYRTQKYNSAIGGARSSTHLTAEGADIRPSKHADIAEFSEDILRIHKSGKLPGLGGVGVYPNWVHVDIRKATDGHLRRWTGGGVGSENT